jgi:predicted small secreted protein
MRLQKVKKWSEGSIRGFLNWGGTSTKSLKKHFTQTFNCPGIYIQTTAQEGVDLNLQYLAVHRGGLQTADNFQHTNFAEDF